MAVEAIVKKKMSAAPVELPNGDGAVAVGTDISVRPTGTIEDLADYLGVGTEEAIGLALDRIKESDEIKRRMVELFEKNPIAGKILATSAERGDFMAGLAATLTPEEYAEEISALTEGSPAFLARQEKLAAERAKSDRSADLQAAIAKSERVFDEWAAAKGLTEEQLEAFEKTLRELARVFEDMNITSDELDKLWRWTDMDNILARSVEDAAIAARNDEKSKKRSSKLARTDVPIPDIPEAGSDPDAEEAIPPELAELAAIVRRDGKRRNPFG